MQIELKNEAIHTKPSKADPIMRQALLYSVIAHILVIGGLVVQTTFFKSTTPIDIQSAVRVDVLGLPDKYKPEDFAVKPEPEAAKPQTETPKPEPVPVVKEPVKEPPKEKVVEVPKKGKPEPDAVALKKKKQQDAIQKLKAQSALDKIKDSLSTEKKSGKQIKGNAIAPGTELTGLDKLVHKNYGNELNRHIKQFWALPEWLRNKPLKALIKVRINEGGLIISKELVKGSGNQSFDESALGTVEQSAPFPAPPEKLADLVRVDGILIGFPE